MVNIEIQKQIVQIEVIVNIACRVNPFEDVGELDAEGANGLRSEVSTTLAEEFLERHAVLRYDHIRIHLGIFFADLAPLCLRIQIKAFRVYQNKVSRGLRLRQVAAQMLLFKCH